MNYKSFEDLPVWQAAIEFALKIFGFTEKAEKEFRGLGDTKNQLERAAIYISNNVAEGFERGTNAELINFSTSPEVRRANAVRCFVCAKDYRDLPFRKPIFFNLKLALKMFHRSFTVGLNH
jgi:hypothetical protein